MTPLRSLASEPVACAVDRLGEQQARHDRALASLRHLIATSNVPRILADITLHELEDSARQVRLAAGRDGWQRAAALYGLERSAASRRRRDEDITGAPEGSTWTGRWGS